jgi:hypothetical protein
VAAKSNQELDAMIDEAVVDAYTDDEQLVGMFTMIQDNLAVPFTTEVLGVEVTVQKVDLIGNCVVAICTRGRHRQAIPILDLPLPTPPPEGADWIDAYDRWSE